MKIIFLDIDGVLNGHQGSCLIDRACVERLNRIIYETDAQIVISSSWRYMVLNGAMTLDGFHYMLRTHGLTGCAKLIATTVSDEEVIGRPLQIARGIATHHPSTFVILDDDWIEGFAERLIQTDGELGMSDADADRAIGILN